MLTLLIADDHPLYRDALKGALSLSLQQLSLLEAGDLQQTLQLLQEHAEIDLLLLDLHMPGSGDLFGLLHIRKLFPELPVAVISGLEDSQIINKVISAGAIGFIAKTTGAAQLAQAIETMLDGDVWLPPNFKEEPDEASKEFNSLAHKISELTPAQYRVLCCLRDGLLNKQIGFKLDIAEATVKAHITSIFRKLAINNRTQAVLIASQLQLQAPESD